MVVAWGAKIGEHGADVFSVDITTGRVMLWDAKFRGSPVKVGPSPTLTDKKRLANAVADATKQLINDTTLPADIRQKALAQLEAETYKTKTIGFGNARAPDTISK